MKHSGYLNKLDQEINQFVLEHLLCVTVSDKETDVITLR